MSSLSRVSSFVFSHTNNMSLSSNLGANICTAFRSNANRLWKHQPWDEWHPDTGMVQKEEDESQKKIVAEHSTEKDSRGEQGKQRILQEGEVIVFPKEMSENDPLPFGIGRVMGMELKEGQGIQFQWPGNTTFNPRGTFLPGWLDPVDRKFYFQPRPRSKKHTEFMGKDEGVQVTREEVIAHGFRILTDANRLSMNTRTVITSSKVV
jgi:hypothetical protein